MKMHEKQQNLQEWRIGCVENILGTYVEEIQWWIILLKFLFILVFNFRDSMEDIIVLIKRTSDNRQMKTGGVGEPLFDHCSLCSYLRGNNTRETDDGRTPCAKTRTVKSVMGAIRDKKAETIIQKVKSKYLARTHKYGIRVPKNIREALEIDKENATLLVPRYASKLVYCLS
jgi:hypothetical protein